MNNTALTQSTLLSRPIPVNPFEVRATNMLSMAGNPITDCNGSCIYGSKSGCPQKYLIDIISPSPWQPTMAFLQPSHSHIVPLYSTHRTLTNNTNCVSSSTMRRGTWISTTISSIKEAQKRTVPSMMRQHHHNGVLSLKQKHLVQCTQGKEKRKHHHT